MRGLQEPGNSCHNMTHHDCHFSLDSSSSLATTKATSTIALSDDVPLSSHHSHSTHQSLAQSSLAAADIASHTVIAVSLQTAAVARQPPITSGPLSLPRLHRVCGRTGHNSPAFRVQQPDCCWDNLTHHHGQPDVLARNGQVGQRGCAAVLPVRLGR